MSLLESDPSGCLTSATIQRLSPDSEVMFFSQEMYHMLWVSVQKLREYVKQETF